MGKSRNLVLALLATLLVVSTQGVARARDALGVFGDWAAFRDPAVPRCYAIAQPARAPNGPHAFAAYADVGDWPTRALRGQFHTRLARTSGAKTPVTLSIGGQRFKLVAAGADAWAADERMDAAITAAMRSATGFSISAHDAAGHEFSATWTLSGAATAMDAALIGCAPAH